ncbi:MAG: LysR family transcriptional regulator [Janthinobacterium lividum]
MDLTWLDDFLALAEVGNFSRAAMRRHVTQPAFSRRIRSLEDWAGVALFDRAAQPVALTPAGQALRPAALDLVQRLLSAREVARDAGASAGGLRFAATHALSFSFFPAWLRSLEVTGPVATHLASDSLQACERLMLLGRAQFLLCHAHPAVPSRLESGFDSLIVGHDTLHPVSAPDASGQPRFRLGDTGAVSLAYSQESGLGRIVAAVRPGGDTRLAFTSPLAAVLRGMARDGRGRAWLPRSLIASDLTDGSLCHASEVADDIALEIRLFRGEDAQSPTAAAFWDGLQRQKIDCAAALKSPKDVV